MIEKVNPSHPDKLADRIAGAIVDLCYKKTPNPKCAVEVLIGHGHAYIITETSVKLQLKEIKSIVKRIAGDITVKYIEVPQDPELSKNQSVTVRCGDNGIFKGVPVDNEVKELSTIARILYDNFPSDGKYILANNRLIVCQSNADENSIKKFTSGYDSVVNPLGYWTGGTDVDTGATNRKLGSDMGEAVTGGGLHGKDLSKADVSVNIYAHILAQKTGSTIEMCCAIGDDSVNGIPYEEIVSIAKQYVDDLGGFEKLAEWGLV